MRTVLICHHNDNLNRAALPRWLSSFSEVVGIVSIQEGSKPKHRRVRREVERIGIVRFFDVLAFRVYHRLFVREQDRAFERELLARMQRRYPELPSSTPVLTTGTPNSPETRGFLERLAPDLVIARCKVILKREIFSVPVLGTFVMHPGICPEYRNSHGCFWALANEDLDKVGMTLLKIDAGIDTGPVYGFFGYDFDEVRESHIVIQTRTVFENLDAIRDRLIEVERGVAVTIDTSGRESGVWGQPWLTKYLTWKRAAKRRAKNAKAALGSVS